MAQLLPFRLLLAAAGLLAAGEAALAQSAACQRYQAELASLPRGGGRQAAAAADRYRAEAARLGQYYRSIGCERQQFGFFASPPAECGAIAQRMRQMEAGAGQIADQAESAQVEGRRRWLLSAIDQACNAAPERARSADAPSTPRRQEAKTDSDDGERATGGRRTVCVRACDGYFFPLSNTPSGRESEDTMCRALCPGAETAAYTMPGGDDGLDNAISAKGKPYAQLANAFKFRKAFDPSCSCKKPGQSWAVALREAEKMIDRRRGDIVVTAQKAEELSRPKFTTAQIRARKAEERKSADDAEAQAQAAAGAAAPTAGGESAGIGPKAILADRTIPRGEGEKHELVAADGSRRVVRVIAAGVIPVPDNVADQIAASRQAATQQTAANQAASADAITTGSIGPPRR
ncbi:MAG TPA: DUF2865 domain-containing protein [Microvirga sp.]|jgi:hypothetical protein|nr:DUF2865 domain-containing protein [Microvirga sp.]